VRLETLFDLKQTQAFKVLPAFFRKNKNFKPVVFDSNKRPQPWFLEVSAASV